MILSIKDLSFSYSSKRVLNSINLQFHQGENVALLGKNGSGKSTLLKCILNILPYSGSVLVDDKESKAISNRDRSRLMSYIPQQSRNIYSYSLLSFTLMGVTPTLSTLSSPSEKDEEEALRVLDKLGIAHLKDRDVTTLSGGERQLALSARALLSKSRILLFDEPTSALDYKNSIKLLEHIKELSRERYLSITSLHTITDALNYSSRIILLKEGEVFFDGSVDNLVNSDILSSYYETKISIEYYKNQYILLNGGSYVVE